jgi:2'-5' RNA ligase
MERFFIAFVIDAPWPDLLPAARYLIPEERHLTLAFIGKAQPEDVVKSFETLPMPSFKVGFCSYFDQLLFLPEHPSSPRVVAWHAKIPHEEAVRAFVTEVHIHMGLVLNKPWLPHVTIGRSPFEKAAWEKAFQPLPFMTYKIALFESLGHLRYKPLAEIALAPPLERLEHTADIAFIVRGASINELLQNALIGLSFDDPRFLRFQPDLKEVASIDEIIIALNHFIAVIDEVEGSPFKAVSFHGNLKQTQDFYEWEMIVDV